MCVLPHFVLFLAVSMIVWLEKFVVRSRFLCVFFIFYFSFPFSQCFVLVLVFSVFIVFRFCLEQYFWQPLYVLWKLVTFFVVFVFGFFVSLRGMWGFWYFCISFDGFSPISIQLLSLLILVFFLAFLLTFEWTFSYVCLSIYVCYVGYLVNLSKLIPIYYLIHFEFFLFYWRDADFFFFVEVFGFA